MTITSIIVACSSTIASSSPVVLGGGAAVPAGGGIPGGAGVGLAIESKSPEPAGGLLSLGSSGHNTNKRRKWREKSRFDPYPRHSVCILCTRVCGKDLHDGSDM